MIFDVERREEKRDYFYRNRNSFKFETLNRGYIQILLNIQILNSIQRLLSGASNLAISWEKVLAISDGQMFFEKKDEKKKTKCFISHQSPRCALILSSDIPTPHRYCSTSVRNTIFFYSVVSSHLQLPSVPYGLLFEYASTPFLYRYACRESIVHNHPTFKFKNMHFNST